MTDYSSVESPLIYKVPYIRVPLTGKFILVNPLTGVETNGSLVNGLAVGWFGGCWAGWLAGWLSGCVAACWAGSWAGWVAGLAG